MGLELLFHGGLCCGIKTLQGFTWGKPFHACCPVVKKHDDNRDTRGDHVQSNLPFFTDEAPKESYEERLDRLIKWCKERRPQGAIEAVLASSYIKGERPEPTVCDCGECDEPCVLENDMVSQVEYWGPVLESHGFKLSAPPFKNSNSGNYIYIYHLVYDTKTDTAPSSTPNPFGL